MKPTTATSKTPWDRVSEGDGDFGFETDRTKAGLREELESLEGRERFIDEAIEGGKSVEDQLRGKESLKVCAAKRPA